MDSPDAPAGRNRVQGLAGGGTLLVLLLLGLGSAAARPGGTLVGLPSAGAALVAFALLAVLAAVTKGAGAPCAVGLLVPVLVLFSGAPLPGVGALSGPPLLAVALAGTAVALARARPSVPRLVFLPVVFAFYALVAARGQIQVGPQGDEPHYLMVAESLLRDHDVSLESDYAEGRYLAFRDPPLEPHYRVRGKGGEIYSLHAVGLSVLILPAFALGGYPAVSLFMAFLAALLALEVRELVRDAFGRDDLAEGVGWIVALSPPLVSYAGLVFTEVPAALVVAFALRRLPRESRGTALAVGVALACLPWLNVRYAPVAALLLAYGLWTRARLRERLALLAPMAVSAAGIAAYHFALYGFFDPRRVYGRRPEFALGTLPEGLPGLFLDQEFGLLVYAPVFALALPGFFQHWRKDRRESVLLVALVAAVVLTAAPWPMWRGGFNPPARFLVPVLPVLALAVAGALGRGLTAGAALLVGWSVWIGLTGAADPRLVHRDRDGTAPLFRAASGAEEWTRLLPGYVLADPDRHRLALVWAGALLLALPWRRRPPTALRLAGASVGLLAAAGVASTVAHARTEGRDAVRTMGRTAIGVPGWSVRVWPARWGPDVLEWGPVFEPHRHPEGVVLGGRLPLPNGAYILRLEGERLGPAAPALLVQPDRPGSPWRLANPAADGEWRFEVVEADGPVTLRLRGGGPFLLKGVDLLLQP